MHAKQDLNRENVENSATLKLRRTYQGREWDWTSDSQKLTERWVGTQDLCLEGLQENRPGKVTENGTISQSRVYQDNATFWILEIVYEIESLNYEHSLGGGEDTASRNLY